MMKELFGDKARRTDRVVRKIFSLCADFSRDRLMVLGKYRFENHHTIAEAAEVGSVPHFFCENVTWIDSAWNVTNVASS